MKNALWTCAYSMRNQEQPEVLLSVSGADLHDFGTPEVQLTPSRKWPGKGLLGVTIRFDCFQDAENHLLHVTVRSLYASAFPKISQLELLFLDLNQKVLPGSPAAVAGLRSGSDYLLGTPEIVFRGRKASFSVKRYR